MGTVLPGTAIPNDAFGTGMEKQNWLQEKTSWQMDRGSQGNLTLDVLRYTESGGSAYAHIDPTYSQVSNLTGLRAYVDSEPKEYEKKFGALVEEASVVFILYDVPGGLTKFDLLKYNGDEYKIISIDYNERSGRYEILSALNREDI
jgi:hypothetical protein